MQKRGLSGVIVSVLLILISIVAVIILWQVVKMVIKTSASDVDTSRVFVNMDVKKNGVKINQTLKIAEIRVNWDSGEANVVKMKFVLGNGSNSLGFEKDATGFGVLQEKTFYINFTGNLTNITSITIYPVIRNEEGKEITGMKVYEYKVSGTEGVVITLGSCSSIGGNICTSGQNCQGGTMRTASDTSYCCVGGTCSNSCTPQCSLRGNLSCSGNNIQNCTYQDGDSCLDLITIQTCSGNAICQNGACVCQPNCAGKTCGDDGCGGECQPGCLLGEICQSGNCIKEITTCTTISEPGVYVLNSNIQWDWSAGAICVRITANDTTLDCQGYTINGVPCIGGGCSGITGVYVTDEVDYRVNIVNIKNCRVTGFNQGIYFNSVYNSTLTSNILELNAEGIIIMGGSNNNLTSNTVSSNYGSGISLYSSSGNTLTSNNLTLNYYDGISLSSSSGNNFTSNTVNLNSFRGIWFYSSPGNTLTSNTVSSNSQYGIWLFASPSNTLTSNTVCLNINKDFNCEYSSASGTGNTFGTGKIQNCDDGWPVLGTDYTACS